MADVQKIIREDLQLTGKRSNWDSYQQDVASFCMPYKANITTPHLTGDRLKFNWLYSSVAIRDLKKSVAGFHSNLTNPSTKWFRWTLYNENEMSRASEIWFKRCTEIMFQVFSQTNLYNVLKEFYGQYIGLGTGPILKSRHPKKKLVFKSVPLGNINFKEDKDGSVISVYNSFKLTAEQAVGMWGKDKVGKAVNEMFRDKPQNEMDFMHYVGPRDVRNPYMMDQKNMPFSSCWIAKAEKHEIEEQGLPRLPYYVGRFWKVEGDPFGYSPAMDALAEIKLLNAAIKTWLRRAMKEADPPIQMPSRGFAMPLNMNPAGIIYRDPAVPNDALQAVGFGAGQFSITEKFLDYIERNIHEAFFVDVFQSFSLLTKNMTVPEVQKRISEGMVLLGPIVNQCEYEVLTPLLTDCFFDLMEQGAFPPMPEELAGKNFGPVYESPLSRAAKETELTNLDQYLARAAQISAVMGPQALDPINTDRVLQFVAKTLGIDPQLMNSPEEIKLTREQRQQLEQARLVLEGSHKEAAIQDTASKANKNNAQAQAVARA